MSNIPQRVYWPYDEVQISRDAGLATRFRVATPWLEVQLDLTAESAPAVAELSEKLSSGQMTAEDLPLVNTFFSATAHHPFAYILPRSGKLGPDAHCIQPPALHAQTPEICLKSLLEKNWLDSPAVASVCAHPTTRYWTWERESALAFSRTREGRFDPQSLFSVARRFHLLNDLEWNQTGALLDYVRTLKDRSEEFRRATSFILKQNHYITEQCDPVLRAALPLAQSAVQEVMSFIQAEAGHDRLLARALADLGFEANTPQLIDSVIVLMAIFKAAGKRNFLAFAMIVDIFERTSFHEKDPVAMLLDDGGQQAAAHHIDLHRKINDEGEHENVALDFLKSMDSVDFEYANEALALAELTTMVIHQMSSETLFKLKMGASADAGRAGTELDISTH